MMKKGGQTEMAVDQGECEHQRPRFLCRKCNPLTPSVPKGRATEVPTVSIKELAAKREAEIKELKRKQREAHEAEVAEANKKKQEKKTVDMIDRSGQTWDVVRCQWVDIDKSPAKGKQDAMISITTNTRGSTQMTTTTKDYSEMSMAELVEAHNKIADKPVKRFASVKAGIKRLQALTGGDGKKGVKPKGGKKAAKSGGKAANAVIEAFQARSGTVREKLLNALHDHYKKQVPVPALLKSCYGSMNIENRGALMMSLRGAFESIKKDKLPYQIKKEKNDETKEISFGLYPK